MLWLLETYSESSFSPFERCQRSRSAALNRLVAFLQLFARINQPISQPGQDFLAFSSDPQPDLITLLTVLFFLIRFTHSKGWVQHVLSPYDPAACNSFSCRPEKLTSSIRRASQSGNDTNRDTVALEAKSISILRRNSF
jgi:hypothetical protein